MSKNKLEIFGRWLFVLLVIKRLSTIISISSTFGQYILFKIFQLFKIGTFEFIFFMNIYLKGANSFEQYCIFKVAHRRLEMFALRLHLFTPHVTDDLHLKSYTEPLSGSVVVREATLVSRHDTAGRCTASRSLHCSPVCH